MGASKPRKHRVTLEYYPAKGTRKEGFRTEPRRLPELNVGDIVEFRPEPEGILQLTFKKGFKFQAVGSVNGKSQVTNQNEKLTIESVHERGVQIEVLPSAAKKKGAATDAPQIFPSFMCKLIVTYKGGIPNPPRDGGFHPN